MFERRITLAVYAKGLKAFSSLPSTYPPGYFDRLGLVRCTCIYRRRGVLVKTKNGFGMECFPPTSRRKEKIFYFLFRMLGIVIGIH